MPNNDEKRWITGPLRTVAQVAKRLGVSRQTVIRYFDAGQLRGADLSAVPLKSRRRRLLRFRDDDIDHLAEVLARQEAIDVARTGRKR